MGSIELTRHTIVVRTARAHEDDAVLESMAEDVENYTIGALEAVARALRDKFPSMELEIEIGEAS